MDAGDAGQAADRARRHRRTFTAVGVLVVAAAAGTFAVRSSTRHERVAPPDVRMEVGIISAFTDDGRLFVTFAGSHPDLGRDDPCYVSYTTTVDPGDDPAELVVTIVGHHPPRPKDVVCLEDFDWARRQDIGPDRGYTSVVDGPVGVAHKVTVAP